MTEYGDLLATTEDTCIAEDIDRGLTLTAVARLQGDFVDLIEAATFGTSGLRYKRLDVASQIERLPSPTFVEMRQNDKLIGTYVLASSDLTVDSLTIHGIYRALLTVAEEQAGLGLGRWMMSQTLDWIGQRAAESGTPVMTWGCVEERNEPSLHLLQSLGLDTLGALESMMAYRQWPRREPRVVSVDSALIEAVSEARNATIADCGLTQKVDTDWLALVVDGKVRAAARASLVQVNMETIGGFWDSAYRHLLRYVPPARLRFDPENFTYVRISDPVVMPEGVGLWGDFISGLMALNRTHMAMFVLDPRSRARRLLNQGRVFGRLGKATRQSIQVIANSWNVNADVLAAIRSRPLGLGPLDI